MIFNVMARFSCYINWIARKKYEALVVKLRGKLTHNTVPVCLRRGVLLLDQTVIVLVKTAMVVSGLTAFILDNNNNNNNNHDDIYSAVIYGASHMREFTVVHLGESRPAPGGRQLAGQAANLTFESACRLL